MELWGMTLRQPPCKYARVGGAAPESMMRAGTPGNRHWVRCTIAHKHQFGDQPAHTICMLKCPLYEGPKRTPKLREQCIGITIKGEPQHTPRYRRWHDGWLTPWLVRKAACGCGKTANEKAPIYQWAGHLYYGWPFLLRIALDDDGHRVSIKVKQHAGCGCIKILKDATRSMFAWMETTYAL
jgi:hypothetical protein